MKWNLIIPFSSKIYRKAKRSQHLLIIQSKIVFHIARPSHIFKLRKGFGPKVKCQKDVRCFLRELSS